MKDLDLSQFKTTQALQSMEEVVAMVNDCDQRSSSLSDWEVDFIIDMKARVDSGAFYPTPKQIETLEEIWERIT